MGKKHTLFRKTCLLFSVFIILVLRSYCGATHRKLQVSIEPRNTTVHIENVVPAIELHRGNVALPDIASHVLAAERAGRGKKIISMSLYGNDARYTLGAIINAMLTQRDWPGWTLRMYVGDGVPNDVVALLHFFGVELVKITSNQKGIAGMFWRFYALEDRTATRVIVRDADARLTKRDRSAVEEWIESGRYFHVLNDHPFHSVPIMGGMWGAVNGFVNPHVLQEWRNQDNKTGQHYSKGTDQAWLASVVWPAVKTHTLQHASHFCGAFGAAEWRGFPTPRESPCDFVGNVFWDENGWEGDKVADPEMPTANCHVWATGCLDNGSGVGFGAGSCGTPSASLHAAIWQENFCMHVKEGDARVRKWLEQSGQLLVGAYNRSTTSLDASIFSKFITTQKCGLTMSETVEWIEPLAFGLRNPEALCLNKDKILDRTYLIVADESVATARRGGRPCVGRRCQVIYFDLGAGTWDLNPDGHQPWKPWNVRVVLLPGGPRTDIYV